MSQPLLTDTETSGYVMYILRRTHIFVLTIALLMAPGCSTILQSRNEAVTYGGTQLNIMGIACLGLIDGPGDVVIPLLAIIDLPLSLVLDTLHLIYTLPKYMITGKYRVSLSFILP